jgi:hypothetical protein
MLAADAAGELHILRLDGHALGVDASEVGVLEKRDQIGLGRLLERRDRVALETELSREILGNLAHEALEWQLPDEKLGVALVAPYFLKGDSAWTPTMFAFGAAGRRQAPTHRFQGEGLWGGPAACALSSGLLRAGHAATSAAFSAAFSHPHKSPFARTTHSICPLYESLAI